MQPGRPFILNVAQHRRNKNIPLLLRAFADLLRQRSIAAETCLVIVGSQGPLTNLIRSTISSMSLTHNVVMSGMLPDSELCWLYRNCDLFVAPSSIEGFGLPLAEALRCGARIVCSDIPVFREIAGNECFYFSPESAIAAVELSRACVLALCRRPPGPRPLDAFSSNVVGPQHVAVYSRILRERRGVAITPSPPADRSMSYDSSIQ
jgi:glycosyltransferase involved in cell wall biosynthesis